MPVIAGAAEYPAEILDELRDKGVDVEEIDALETAREAGSAKAVNIVLMARLARHLDIPEEKWLAAIEKTVKPAFRELNIRAFKAGYEN